MQLEQYEQYWIKRFRIARLRHMARTKAFDVALTLDEVTTVFAERGYEATSIRDVMARTGISSSSLYATFGDKRDVYLAALEHHRRLEREQFRALLDIAQPVRATLDLMIAGLIAEVLSESAERGSLTLKAAVEFGARDAAVTALLREHLDDLTLLLAERLRVAQASGEIAARHDAGALARHLLFGLYSLAVMARLYPERRRLESTAALLTAVLDC